jgi:UDP-N-acetyl-D-mannosaminuronate dehydrogenase
VVSSAREANSRMPAYAVDVLSQTIGDLSGRRVAVLGVAYRGGVKETAFSGVFPTVDELRARGATVLVHDPMYDDAELTAMGFEPYHLGDPVEAAIVQADHAEYRTLTADRLPGVTALVDGRGVTDPQLWPGVRRLVIGDGTPGRTSP